MKKTIIAISLLVGGIAVAGIRVTTTRTADAAIDQYALVKPSTTAGRVVMVAAGDSGYVVTGVAQTSAAGAGSTLPIIELQGIESKMLSDGTGSIAAGDPVKPSATVAGRITKDTAPGSNTVGIATSACAATLNCQLTVL